MVAVAAAGGATDHRFVETSVGSSMGTFADDFLDAGLVAGVILVTIFALRDSCRDQRDEVFLEVVVREIAVDQRLLAGLRVDACKASSSACAHISFVAVFLVAVNFIPGIVDALTASSKAAFHSSRVAACFAFRSDFVLFDGTASTSINGTSIALLSMLEALLLTVLIELSSDSVTIPGVVFPDEEQMVGLAARTVDSEIQSNVK
jgi:hypothetical protein